MSLTSEYRNVLRFAVSALIGPGKFHNEWTV